jgi:hypothetical protein
VSDHQSSIIVQNRAKFDDVLSFWYDIVSSVHSLRSTIGDG